MDDTELYREQILRHYGPVITGRFLGFRDSYTREVKIGQPLALAVFVTASVIGMLVRMIRSGGSRRKFKDLKKGPEYLVTLVRLRDDLGQIYEVEMHGQLPQSALHRGDLVQVRVLAQKDPDLPVKLQQLINLETLQPFRPWVPTMWSHLGAGLLIQAVLGTIVTLAVATAWIS
ncbi:hypothetical protein [Actinoplanes sp. TFC3]|uniref:hypothetical protein n=1 Tax=Actinoplanes sp. TFC3 TaxID=1710355 RepID=UPI00082F69F9|nr:hypothetical protein [Actinoplanes sp. TFC3]